MPATPWPTETGPASPCVQICALDAGGICLGCGRSLDEIARWSTASAATQRAILVRARERLALRTSADQQGR
ncbi:DUF1289 domain-containing protein [Sediminicoccus sp. KRV36]|uniref:DUF1289 domain-containing protein n=1 Tax=Sediminicoccus sp. KRV36 TaxID=3133721 RepID=UPI00200BADEF|nr:DUF1289 domain-containing protein [Sediminicoccus rosea]UPY37858.1 DUF1289 domain-containing protein [Sediminicoccus rosea]